MKLTAFCLTYNRPHLVGELIQCFLHQDYPKHLRELIILDDAGQYSNQEGDGWKLISVPRRFNSLGEKRNACIALASPDTDAFLVADDDDIYLPHWFSACARALREGDFCRPSLVLSMKNGRLKAAPTGGLYHAGWAFRKSIFYKVNGYKAMDSGEDQELGSRLIAARAKIVDPCKFYPPYLVWRRGDVNTYHVSCISYKELGKQNIKYCGQVNIHWSKPWDKLPIELPGGQIINQVTAHKPDAPNRPLPKAHEKPPLVHVSSSTKRVNLVRALQQPFPGGPGIGMYALQKLLRKEMVERGVDWLDIVDRPANVLVLPWFWWLEDRPKIIRWDKDVRRPFVVGPNVFFIDSSRPRSDELEKQVLDASHCKMIFCHSQWYKELILANVGASNKAEIVMWPYPVDPWPEGPKKLAYDLLIYVKNHVPNGLPELLSKTFPNSITIRYGQYKREELFAAAARSAACAYLSQDESGGIATAEIMLAGCPIVGVKTGAPFITENVTGVFVPVLPKAIPDTPELVQYIEAITKVQEFDRSVVREFAAEQFDNRKIASTVLDALDKARHI